MDIEYEEPLAEYTADNCPLNYTLSLIGGKWKIPILGALCQNGTMRFNQLKKDVQGITNTMLSNSLQELENDNLVKRIQYNEMPVRVEYSLTEMCDELIPILIELSKWGILQMSSRQVQK